jgi:hypothetical protein
MEDWGEAQAATWMTVLSEDVGYGSYSEVTD